MSYYNERESTDVASLCPVPMSCVFSQLVMRGMLFLCRRRQFRAGIFSLHASGRADTMKNKIISAAKWRKIERNTIWVLSCEVKGSSRFLGAYPSWAEADQAAREEFKHLHRTVDVQGYAPAMVDARFAK